MLWCRRLSVPSLRYRKYADLVRRRPPAQLAHQVAVAHSASRPSAPCAPSRPAIPTRWCVLGAGGTPPPPGPAARPAASAASRSPGSVQESSSRISTNRPSRSAVSAVEPRHARVGVQLDQRTSQCPQALRRAVARFDVHDPARPRRTTPVEQSLKRSSCSRT